MVSGLRVKSWDQCALRRGRHFDCVLLKAGDLFFFFNHGHILISNFDF